MYPHAPRRTLLVTSDYANRQKAPCAARPETGSAQGEPTVPKSRVRKKAVYTPPQRSAKIQVSPRWLAPVMVACWLLGLAWIATYYVLVTTDTQLEPFKSLGNGNLAIGFVALIIGIVLATRWR